MSELHEHRLKRLKMRSMRRGIKEMDLILQDYAEARLADLDETQLSDYDAMLNENDHDLYQWVTGQTPAAAPFEWLITDIQSRLPQHRA